MKKKMTRKTLLIIIAAMGLFMILYSLVRQFTGFGLGESAEKYMFDIIIFGALGLFIYNRKMAKDEKQAEAARLDAEREEAEKAAEAAAPPPVTSGEDDSPQDDADLPHWERRN